MKSPSAISGGILIALLLCASPISGYEDLTHQQLTKRSLVVAAINSPEQYMGSHLAM